MLYRSRCVYCGFALALMTVGCAPAGNANLVPVTGRVNLDGTPVSGANVVFRSDNSVGFGMTDDSGRFELQSQGEERTGVEPGTYKVMVTKIPATEVVAQDMDEALENPISQTPESGTKNELPERYADFVNSPLEFTVAAGETNDFTIDLESSPGSAKKAEPEEENKPEPKTGG